MRLSAGATSRSASRRRPPIPAPCGPSSPYHPSGILVHDRIRLTQHRCAVRTAQSMLRQLTSAASNCLDRLQPVKTAANFDVNACGSRRGYGGSFSAEWQGEMAANRTYRLRHALEQREYRALQMLLQDIHPWPPSSKETKINVLRHRYRPLNRRSLLGDFEVTIPRGF